MNNVELNKYIWQLIVVIFLAGGGWITLSTVQAQTEENKKKIEEVEKVEANTEKRLERMEVTQEYIKKELDAQDKKLDKILDKLEER